MEGGRLDEPVYSWRLARVSGSARQDCRERWGCAAGSLYMLSVFSSCTRGILPPCIQTRNPSAEGLSPCVAGLCSRLQSSMDQAICDAWALVASGAVLSGVLTGSARMCQNTDFLPALGVYCPRASRIATLPHRPVPACSRAQRRQVVVQYGARAPQPGPGNGRHGRRCRSA